MLKKWTEQQIQHCLHSFEQSHRQLQDNMDGLLNRQSALDTGLKEQRSHQEQCVGTQAARLRHMEAKLNNKMDSLEKSLHHELQLLKHNYHKGFRSVHDAIETLKEITDLKSRLDKGHIKKELGHIYSNLECRKLENRSDTALWWHKYVQPTAQGSEVANLW
uniref:Uncharacterized protein n=1 Tax=Knipowitschia caucasica TaxID=637954 RepID=A0AAV2MRI2_KNICA